MRPRKDAGVRANWRTRACAALIVLAATAIALSAQTFTTLLSFDNTDGANPYSALVQASDGNFYGTTNQGGANDSCYDGISDGCGTVFKITPSGALTTLYSFCSQSGCADGRFPHAGLVQASDGNFYGTTSSGGANQTACNLGCGTVFRITPSGTLTTLYSFCPQSDCTDGGAPFGTLIQATDGNFYGTTSEDGANGDGTVFKITGAGALTTLHSFAFTDGEFPLAELVQGIDGNFYGTTSQGGTNDGGTLFKITPSGTLTTLYKFCSQSSCTDGSNPSAGLLQAADGNFYGTASSGGAHDRGTVFTITPSGTLTTLYSFCSQGNCTDGGAPAGALVQATDGNFYGTTSEYGVNSAGTIFKITPGGALTTLYSLGSTDTDGVGPFAPLIQDTNGNFYGTTLVGGANLFGTVFSLSVGLGRPLSLGLHFDFDGDAGTDYNIWRPSNGTWYILPSNGGKSIATQWGKSGDTVVPGDYDGDGKTDYAVWRPSNGTWYVILSSTGKSTSYVWGESTDIPVPGDYDGDGKTDYAVWRPSNGTWYVVLSSTGKSTSYKWGLSTDVAVSGDFDGDGKTDYAIWRPSTGTWWVILSSTGKTTSKQWGLSTDEPVPGDYDGDGKTDYAVWRPSNGTWYVVDSSTGATTSDAWGKSTDMPVPRDYDGDNKTDYAVWRPSNGTWYVVNSSKGKTVTTQWGLSTDVPVNKPPGE
jgi:uncharacterized repeat protein (TIGR03803 family)